MDPAATAALLVTLAALLSYLNHRFLRLPSTIGLMLMAFALSIGVMMLDAAGVPLVDLARAVLEPVDFDQTLMTGMLSFLLFAGAPHIVARSGRRRLGRV